MASIVFMGTPQFAVPALEALLREQHVAGVVTQPDRPAGRGRQVQPAAVTQLARERGLPLLQPASLRKQPEAVEQIRRWAPDVIVVAAFGQILKPDVLAIAPRGVLNVHASLLPRWRGAAPIPYAILEGDQVTGVSIMQLDPGLDSGPVLLAGSEPIRPEDTGATLAARLAVLGADLLVQALPGWLDGTLAARPQPADGVTLAPTLKKEQGRLDWTRPAAYLARQVRAYDPWPGTFTTWNGKNLRIVRAAPAARPAGAAPGTVLPSGPGLAVAAGEGCLELHEVQLEGKRALAAAEFARGYPQLVGARLG